MIYLNNRKIEEIRIGEKVTEGGGSTGGDKDAQWKEIGYDKQPDQLTNEINYAKQFKENWNPNQSAIEIIDKKLVYMPNVDWSQATSLSHCLSKCYRNRFIDNVNSSNCTDFSWFNGGDGANYVQLQTINKIDLSKAETVNQMFYYNTFLQKVGDNLNQIQHSDESVFCTKNIKNFDGLFMYCASLEVSPIIDLSSATNTARLFGGCSNLKEIRLKGNPANIVEGDNVGSMYMFYNIPNTGKLYYDANFDYTKIKNELNKDGRSWELIPYTYN